MIKKRLFAVIILLVLTFFVVGGCGPDGAGTETLKGTKWLLTAWSISSLDLSGYSITADFDETDISGRSAVNTYSGAYAITGGGGFKVGELSSTLMGGSEDAMRAEALYFELLQQARKFIVTSTTLTLMDEGNQELLIFQAIGGAAGICDEQKPDSGEPEEITGDDITQIEAAKEQLSRQLLDIEGVAGIGIGEFNNRLCITVFLENDSPELKAKVPEEFQGFPVITEVTGPIVIQLENE